MLWASVWTSARHRHMHALYARHTHNKDGMHAGAQACVCLHTCRAAEVMVWAAKQEAGDTDLSNSNTEALVECLKKSNLSAGGKDGPRVLVHMQ